MQYLSNSRKITLLAVFENPSTAGRHLIEQTDESEYTDFSRFLEIKTY